MSLKSCKMEKSLLVVVKIIPDKVSRTNNRTVLTARAVHGDLGNIAAKRSR